MMKMVMGSLGLYLEGFIPSMTPPCDGARLPSVILPPAIVRDVGGYREDNSLCV